MRGAKADLGAEATRRPAEATSRSAAGSKDRRSAPSSWRKRSASRTGAATASRKTPSRRDRRPARSRSGSAPGPTSTVARSTATRIHAGSSSSRRRLRKWIVALRPEAERDRQGDDAGELQALPVGQQRAGGDDRENRRQDRREHHDDRAEGEADEGGDETNSMVSPRFSFSIILGAVARRDRG